MRMCHTVLCAKAVTYATFDNSGVFLLHMSLGFIYGTVYRWKYIQFMSRFYVVYSLVLLFLNIFDEYEKFQQFDFN